MLFKEPVFMENDIKKIVDILRKGGIIVYPTDTIWGIGCDATNKKAIEKIYRLKHRIHEKSFIVLVKDKEELLKYVETAPELVWDFAEQINSPLTVIYSNAKNLPPNVISADGSVAIRITKDEFCKKIIENLGKPIISTSANISGEIAPLVYSMISEEILNNVDYVSEYKRQKVTEIKPSTIIKITEDGQIEIIRN